MPTRIKIAASALLLAALAFAPPARAAFELEPGLWQDTETGTENGQPAKPEVTTDCMTAEEAKDPIKTLAAAQKEAAGQCAKFDVKQSGNTVTVAMVCGDPKQMSIDMLVTYTLIDRKHYTGTLKSTVVLGGQKMTSDKKVESKWVGATCKK
jgi:hypothetical protein